MVLFQVWDRRTNGYLIIVKSTFVVMEVMKKVKKLIYIMSFFIFQPLIYILPFGFYIELIKFLGVVSAPFFYKRRDIAKKNLFLIRNFSIDQIHTVIQDGIKNVPLTGLLRFSYGHGVPDLFKKYVRIEGKEHLTQALSRGKGVLLTFVHSNTQGIALPYIGGIERLYLIVALQNSNRLSINSVYAKIIKHLRERIRDFECIYTNDEESLKSKISNLLKAGKVVSISADGQHARKFFIVPFFDKKIKMPVGFSKLSVFHQAPIVPLFSGFDRKENIFRIWLGPPILSQTPEMAAEAFSVQFQEHLKKYPSHWTGWWRMKLVQDEKGNEVFHIYSV